MNDDRCEALARIGVKGMDSHRCRRTATRRVEGTRRVCNNHVLTHVFHDADAIGDTQRERAARVMEG